jgi:hypothetical protein
MAPKRDVHSSLERATQREAAVCVVDHETLPGDIRLHQRDRDRIVRVTEVHQHVRTKFSKNGERPAKSFDRFTGQYVDRNGFFDTKDFSHLRNDSGALAIGPDNLVIVMWLRGNQIFKQTRMAAFAIKLRHDVDVATSISQGSRASSVRDTAYFTPD